MTEFGEKLKVLRTGHRLTHVQLAKLCDNKISQPTISLWECGRPIGSVDSLSVLADVFGVTTDWLLGRTDNPFNEDLFFRLEPPSFPFSVGFEGKSVLVDFVEFPKEYVNTYHRSQNYTFLVRANITFLIHALCIEVSELLELNGAKFQEDFESGAKKILEYYLKVDGENNALKEIVHNLNYALKTGLPVFVYDF